MQLTEFRSLQRELCYNISPHSARVSDPPCGVLRRCSASCGTAGTSAPHRPLSSRSAGKEGLRSLVEQKVNVASRLNQNC